MVVETCRTEGIGILPAETLVQVFPDGIQVPGCGMEEPERRNVDDHLHLGHLFGEQACEYAFIHKQELRVGVVDKVMDIACLEFMEYGHRDGAESQGGQETHAPVGLVAATDGDFVPFGKAGLLEDYVQFGDPAGDIPVMQRDAVVIGQGLAVPVGPDALLEHLVHRLEFHRYILL